MAINVRSNPSNTITVRVGQRNVKKVVASNAPTSASTAKPLDEAASDVSDTGRANNTFLMYNGTEYVHVDAAQILDLADDTDDDTIDYGTFD